MHIDKKNIITRHLSRILHLAIAIVISISAVVTTGCNSLGSWDRTREQLKDDLLAFLPFIALSSSGITTTINQAVAQSDPTNALPITFTVVFSEAIDPTSFTTTDITQNGTAGAITWNITNSGDDRNFTLTATASGDGTLIPSMAAGAVQNLAGKINAASTSTDNTVTL